ncbi:ABC transporter ATP-binding protein [Bradyrhizobium cosmicum]|uniref:ABC transporter ATP-binding protein n=1 Tax=Bradyrhizobium cosmicum TaxID=1404864 RepID=UPI0028EF671B|nr:ABC transporter ATP-binding protein [Bradyrhizobium cosmicum]
MTAAAAKQHLDAGTSVICSSLTKVYGQGAQQVTALRGVDLEVARGELIMLVGPSGCGKTSLISIIAGLLAHDSGRCVVLGEDIERMDQTTKAAFRRRSLGFVFQAFNLIPQLTTAENVMIPLLLNGMSEREGIVKARQALERVGLAERSEHFPSHLSGGQQQRVAIARALVHEPELVVCDEPTSALDHATGQHVLDILRGIATGDGRTLIVVTHDQRILRFADRIAHMDDGRITHFEEPRNAAGVTS